MLGRRGETVTVPSASEQFCAGSGLRLLVVPTGKDLTIVVQREVIKDLGDLPPRKKTSRRPGLVLATTLPLEYAQQRFSDLRLLVFFLVLRPVNSLPRGFTLGLAKGLL